MAASDPVLKVGGKQITLSDVVARAKISGAFADTALELARDAAAAGAAKDLGIKIDDQELQAAYDEFRRACQLYKAKDTQAWLEQSGLKVEDIEQYLEAGLLRGKIAEELVPDEQVKGYYAQNPREFEYARVSHIVVKDRNAAQELALSLKEEGEDFADLARTHSSDEETRCGGGYRGLVTRDNTLGLAEDVADRIFAAKAGEVVGPFQSNGVACIVRVEECGRLPLDESLRNRIRATLCEQTLAERSGVS
jgi:parvulin-like peptidyl-prolyl isomerase